MKRALVSSLFVLVACTPTQLEAGRYACQPELPFQCPGAWRCGLEGFCHQLGDTAVAWRCENSSDCEAGWGCGLTNDREHRECHDPSAPRAWNCAEDTDCVSGWRCGTALSCVDPTADTLSPLVLANVNAGTHINSLRSKTRSSKLTVSPLYSQGRGNRRTNLGFVQDGHLQALSLDLVSGTMASFDFGVQSPRSLAAHGARGTDLQGAPDELDRLSVLWADGGLSTFRFADGGVAGQEIYGNTYAAYDMLGQSSATPGVTPSVYAINARPAGGYVRIDGDLAEELDLIAINSTDGLNFSAVPSNRVRSITGLRFNDAVECVYLVDERGLWVSQRGWPNNPNGIASYDFEPVRLDGFTQAACQTGAQPQIKSVAGLEERWLAVTAQASGAALQVSIIDAARTWVSRGGVGAETLCSSAANRPCDADDAVPVDVALGPCAACPQGTALAGLTMIPQGTGRVPALEVVCGQTNVPPAVFRLSPSSNPGECARSLVTGASSFFSALLPVQGLPAGGMTGWSGTEGQLWFGTDFETLSSLTFDRAPAGVVKNGASYLAFSRDLIGIPSPSIGLRSSTSLQLTAPVENAPTLVVAGNVLQALDGGTIGYANALTLEEPVAASITRSTLGTRVGVISANTMIYAGDLEEALAGGGIAVPMQRRLTTVEPIASLAFPKEHALGTGPLLTGYAIVGANLVSVIGDTLARWRTESVPLPAVLLPRETWFQGTRGRVGMQDGSVFALPSRVRISQPVPGGEVVDFAQTCGQQLALTPTGLFRLEPDGTSPVGQWRPIALPAEVSMLDFTEGRVHGLGNDVFVFTRTGEAARVTFDTCPE